MTGRERILSSLQASETFALQRSQLSAVREIPAADLWAVFQDRLQALGGFVKAPADLREVDLSLSWIDNDAAVLLSSYGIESGAIEKKGIWEAEIGLTAADLAIAESGSILLSAGPGRARLASLAPPIHIALVRSSNIVATLEEALERMSDRTSVLVTGPSRTADIEGILIRGIHGPGELWVVPL
ncbi:MAG: lactate utilization protein [Fimbriimonadaceae bacterium]